jgi:hypothetical protein
LSGYVESGVRDNPWTLLVATVDSLWAMGYGLCRPQVDAPIFSRKAGEELLEFFEPFVSEGWHIVGADG